MSQGCQLEDPSGSRLLHRQQWWSSFQWPQTRQKSGRERRVQEISESIGSQGRPEKGVSYSGARGREREFLPQASRGNPWCGVQAATPSLTRRVHYSVIYPSQALLSQSDFLKSSCMLLMTVYFKRVDVPSSQTDSQPKLVANQSL